MARNAVTDLVDCSMVDGVAGLLDWLDGYLYIPVEMKKKFRRDKEMGWTPVRRVPMTFSHNKKKVEQDDFCTNCGEKRKESFQRYCEVCGIALQQGETR